MKPEEQQLKNLLKPLWANPSNGSRHEQAILDFVNEHFISREELFEFRERIRKIHSHEGIMDELDALLESQKHD